MTVMEAGSNPETQGEMRRRSVFDTPPRTLVLQGCEGPFSLMHTLMQVCTPKSTTSVIVVVLSCLLKAHAHHGVQRM